MPQQLSEFLSHVNQIPEWDVFVNSQQPSYYCLRAIEKRNMLGMYNLPRSKVLNGGVKIYAHSLIQDCHSIYFLQEPTGEVVLALWHFLLSLRHFIYFQNPHVFWNFPKSQRVIFYINQIISYSLVGFEPFSLESCISWTGPYSMCLLFLIAGVLHIHQDLYTYQALKNLLTGIAFKALITKLSMKLIQQVI